MIISQVQESDVLLSRDFSRDCAPPAFFLRHSTSTCAATWKWTTTPQWTTTTITPLDNIPQASKRSNLKMDNNQRTTRKQTTNNRCSLCPTFHKRAKHCGDPLLYYTRVDKTFPHLLTQHYKMALLAHLRQGIIRKGRLPFKYKMHQSGCSRIIKDALTATQMSIRRH